MPEQLYCNGKVIFLYNDLTPPAKQVGLGFEHFHFSEHEKLQCPQQAKAHTKSPHSRITAAAGALEITFSEITYDHGRYVQLRPSAALLSGR